MCLECSGDKYLLDDRGCVEECPYGTYADDLLGWCVKCSCECESCSANKYDCDRCTGAAKLNDDGDCVISSPTMPWAKFNADWKSFNLYYPYAGFDVGYRSNFVDLPDSMPRTCKDKILDINWQDPDYAEDVTSVQEKLADLLPEREYAKLEEIASLLQSTSVNGGYMHSKETRTVPWKVFYATADSLFGRVHTLEGLVESDSVHREAIASIDTLTQAAFDVPNLCEKVFSNPQAELLFKLGAESHCEFLQE